MDNNHNQSFFRQMSPLAQLAVALGIVLFAGMVLFLAFVFAGKLFFGTGPEVLDDVSLLKMGKESGYLYYIIVAQDISFFIVPSVIIIFFLEKYLPSQVMDIRKIRFYDLAMIIILAFCAFPVTGFAGELNMRLELPDRFSYIEQWMTGKEEYADEIIERIMSGRSLGIFLLNLMVIAVIPAVGEELIFRGILQDLMRKLLGSGTAAVLITSLVFSAIHFQFYGFLPRFILGLVFGFLFLWTGNLWLPVIAHFINNAVPTAGAYISGWEVINAPSGVPILQQVAAVIIPLVAGIIILLFFRRHGPRFSGKNIQDHIPRMPAS